MAVVRLDRLTKVYASGAAPAADQVSLEIADGEFMVLLGPSGCGKTTTLRMIAGLEAISSGELSIDGRVVNRISAKDRDIAMVFQSYALYPHMTVEENLAFGLRRRGASREEIARRVADVAQSLGLTPYLRRKPHALSGGQRQRVALGRAIVRDPKVFLFDEPLSNLDAALRASTRAEIAALHRRLGVTMIYVTHDQVEAMTLGTRICVMNGGRIAQVGPPLEVYRYPHDTFVAGFIGSPPMNLIPADIRYASAGYACSIGPALLHVPPTHVAPRLDVEVTHLGVRPEHLALEPPAKPEVGMLEGVVERIEALGAETLATVRPKGLATTITARLPGSAALVHGERRKFYFDLRETHLFTHEGLNLVRSPTEGQGDG